MKKKIAVVLTALMVMAMGTTAFAATSPTTKTSETTTTEATAYANVTVAADGHRDRWRGFYSSSNCKSCYNSSG